MKRFHLQLLRNSVEFVKPALLVHTVAPAVIFGAAAHSCPQAKVSMSSVKGAAIMYRANDSYSSEWNTDCNSAGGAIHLSLCEKATHQSPQWDAKNVFAVDAIAVFHKKLINSLSYLLFSFLR